MWLYRDAEVKRWRRQQQHVGTCSWLKFSSILPCLLTLNLSGLLWNFPVPWQDSSPASFFWQQPAQRGPEKGKSPSLSSVSFELLFLRILFTLDLDFEGSTSFYCLLFLNMQFSHQCKGNCGNQQDFWNTRFYADEVTTLSTWKGQGHLFNKEKTDNGVKKDRLWHKVCSFLNQRDFSLWLITDSSCLSKTWFSQEEMKKKRAAMTWHKQELCYCILTKFQYYFVSVMSMAWVSELGTVLRTQKKHSLTKGWSATLKEKLYIR